MARDNEMLSIKPGTVAWLELAPSTYSRISETFFKPSTLESL